MKFRDIYHFIYEYEKRHNESRFFFPENLRVFGERKSEMRVFKTTFNVVDNCGQKRTVYKISTLQRKHPNGATRAYFYFDTDTLDRVFPKSKVYGDAE